MRRSLGALVAGAAMGCVPRGGPSPLQHGSDVVVEASTRADPAEARAEAPAPPTPQPAAIDRAVAEAIGEPLSARTVAVEPWPYRPGFSIALIFAAPGDGGLTFLGGRNETTFTRGEDLHAHLLLLEQAPDGVKVRAAASFVPHVEYLDAWTLLGPTLSLDLAPYAIQKGEYAFGVRFGYTTEFAAGENDTERLYLFRQQGTALIEIFHREMKCTDEQRGPNDLTETTRVLVVAPETAQGFHDLVVKTRSSSGPVAIDDSPGAKPPPKTVTRSTTERWRWSGTRYVTPKEPGPCE